MTRFIRTFKTYKLFHILRPSLKEVTHPTNIVPHALFKFKDTARYGVYALENGLIREKTLKYIVENDLLPFIPSEKDYYVVPALLPFYRKAGGVKNGSGHAPIRGYNARVRAGRVILEFNVTNDYLAARLYNRLKSRLKIKTFFRIRPREKVENILTATDFVDIMNNRRIPPPNDILKKFNKFK
ncbi:hypothetical protein RF11_13118 [Thelohanellus kitauei]|uniref:Uncharacterized protein n=1 Tax=Thelohanellus kitauei TaxID=669202 RepID=A0A0C2N0Y0_THEKT|nr:hypothetical protein RF11_13118 [Thelohanellus kitauei]